MTSGDTFRRCGACNGQLLYEVTRAGTAQTYCLSCWAITPIPRRTIADVAADERAVVQAAVEQWKQAEPADVRASRERRQQDRRPIRCSVCGGEFLGTRAKYCSSACRTMAWRDRNAHGACIVCHKLKSRHTWKEKGRCGMQRLWLRRNGLEQVRIAIARSA